MRFDKVRVASVLVVLTLSSCATPRHVVPDVTSFDRDVYGAWTEVTYPRAAHRPITYGELIAVTPDQLTVLSATGIVTVQKKDVDDVTLTLFSGSKIPGWLAAGIVSTVSHGYFLVATIPLWSLAAAWDNRQYERFAELNYPGASWEELRRGARFPQGLPEGFDVRALRPRPAK
jgi:hypothetical protein